jgi:hypothetical protein
MSNGLAEPWRPNLFMHEVSESTGEANALGFPNDSVICYEATSSRVRIRGDPGIGQEFAKPISGMGGQPLRDVLQVSEWVDSMTLATTHQAIQGRRRPSAPVTPNAQARGKGDIPNY